jgi:fructose-1,6-bisphosphatase/sedoheptulose 1,7-bisphosphatase-like protein
MKSALAHVAAGDEDTTTLRVPMELRNNLKMIAAVQKMTLRELTVSILQKHVRAYETGIDRSLASLSHKTRAR